MNLQRMILTAFGLSLMLMMGLAEARSQTPPAVGQWLKFSNRSFSSFFVGSCQLAVRQEKTSWTFTAPDHSATEFHGFWPTEPGTFYVSSSVQRENPKIDQERFQVNEELKIIFQDVNGRLLPVSYTYILNPDDETSAGKNRFAWD